MEELPKIKHRPRYLLFSAGYEGGSIELHTNNLEELAPVWEESSAMAFDENDDEIWVSRRIDYASFDAFWQEFSSQKKWFYRVPLKVHPAVCEQVSHTLGQLANSAASSGGGNGRYLRRWQQFVAKASPGRQRT